MLNLVFAEPGPGPVVRRGPFREIRADATHMRAPDGEVIARHQDHAWYIGPNRYFRIDCEGPVTLHFENPGGERSGTLGPFFHFSSADGIAYGDGEVCAHVDVDSGCWHSHLGGLDWKEMVVVPAG